MPAIIITPGNPHATLVGQKLWSFIASLVSGLVSANISQLNNNLGSILTNWHSLSKSFLGLMRKIPERFPSFWFLPWHSQRFAVASPGPSRNWEQLEGDTGNGTLHLGCMKTFKSFWYISFSKIHLFRFEGPEIMKCFEAGTNIQSLIVTNWIISSIFFGDKSNKRQKEHVNKICPQFWYLNLQAFCFGNLKTGCHFAVHIFPRISLWTQTLVQHWVT